MGEELGADKTKKDAFGHAVLSGAAETLKELVEKEVDLKTRTVKLGYAQRAAAHHASETDVEESFACGQAAVKATMEGKSGFMVTIKRTSEDPYTWETGLHPLNEIANVEHCIPRDWISEDGWLPNEKFINYARPLIEGELHIAEDGGLPKYVHLAKERVEKKLPALEG